MRNLILKMSVSLDGLVAGPGGESDWMARNRSNDGKAFILDTLWRAGVQIMGSRSYAAWAEYWPVSTDVLAAPMNQIPKVVFSRTGKVARASRAAPVEPASTSWDEARIASGDLAEEIARLKEEPGKDILAQGGAGFARSLVASGLVDEYVLVVHPVALGRGLSLFADLPKPLPLTSVCTKRFAGGAVAHVLRLA